MKVNNLFLAGVVALSLGMTACNNEDVPPVNNLGEGTTFVGMYISTMKDVSTRAVNDNQEDYGGRTEESKLTDLQLLSNVRPQAWTLGETADETGKFWETQTAGTFKVAPWKTNSGPQAMALLFNKGALSADIATAADQTYGSTAAAVDNIAALATDNKFVMTSRAEQKTIVPGITEDAAKTGTSEAQNVFSFDVERIVAQGLVAKDAALEEATADKKERLILPTSSILPSTVPQRHTFSVTMRESVQLEMPMAFTMALHQPLMDIPILRRPKNRKVQLKKI